MNSYISNSKKNFKSKIPRAFIAFLILFILSECVISITFSNYMENPTNAKIREKQIIAREAGQDYDILIFGDSSAAGGINANELEKRTGLDCFNLALIGDATLAGSYFQFKDYLKYNDPPKYILIMDTFDIWQRGLESDRVIRTLAINFYKDLIKTLFGTKLFFSLNKAIIKNFTSYIIPSQIYKNDIYKLIKSKNIIKYFSGIVNSQRQIEQELMENNGSSLYVEIDEEAISIDLENKKYFIDYNIFQVSEINNYYLNKLFEETEKNNITVFMSYPPLIENLYNYKTNSEYIKSYKSFMNSLEEKYDNVKFLIHNFYLVDKEKLSLSIDHLNYEESLVFTKMLSERIIKIINKEL